MLFETTIYGDTSSYLFYTNAKTTMHNKNVIIKTLSEIFKFITQDFHVHTLFFHFELSINANQNENYY
jgi:hypothetical protein